MVIKNSGVILKITAIFCISYLLPIFGYAQEKIITVIADSEDNIISVEPPQGSDPEYIASDGFLGALRYYRNCVVGKWRTLSTYLYDNPELGLFAMAKGPYVAGVFVITSTVDCLREML